MMHDARRSARSLDCDFSFAHKICLSHAVLRVAILPLRELCGHERRYRGES